MNRNLRWRLVLACVVTVGLSACAWYPWAAGALGLPLPAALASKRLALGLDLRGGVQMTLRVNTDDAVPREMRGAAREALVRETVEQARQTIERRVNALGVSEPFIGIQGAIQGAAGDTILVQLPGLADMDRARDIVGKTAMLEWTLVEGGPAASERALLDSVGGRLPARTEIAVAEPDAAAGEPGAFYLVRAAADITGRDLRTARSMPGENGQPTVAFSLASDAARRFAALTSQNVGRRLAIVLDGRVQSAPVIEGPIDRGEGHIVGRFTSQQAADLSLVLRAGALPASMTYLGGRLVGPTLGAASVRAGVVASLAGLGLIAAFMLVYYNRAGINALASVAANLLLLLGMMAYSEAVLTLPGIAGLILTIGMGVDANVLIFERIKEELAAGKAPRAAVSAAFSRVFLTILDTHVASLISAAFLFQFGTGPIRGFATTLTFGLLANVFTSVFFSRALFEFSLSRRPRATLAIQTFSTFKTPALNFHRWRWPAAALSAAVILAGAGVAAMRGLPLGIDFSSGTVVTVKFAEAVAEEAVASAIPGEKTVQRYGNPGDHEMLIRVPQIDAAAEGAALAQEAHRVDASLRTAGLPAFTVTGSETISPAIGADLQRKGAYATLASIVGITAYVALRFRAGFAAGAIAATLHDIAVTLSVLALSGYDLSLNVVAAILTITGYSVNDTIVIFDRVRENLRAAMPRAPLGEVINASVNQTLGRTIITASTAFLSVLALFLFGGDALHGFAFAMLVGIVSGTYSTVFIAAAIAAWLGKSRVHSAQTAHRASRTGAPQGAK